MWACGHPLPVLPSLRPEEGAVRESSTPLEKLVQPCSGEALLEGMFTLCF